MQSDKNDIWEEEQVIVRIINEKIQAVLNIQDRQQTLLTDLMDAFAALRDVYTKPVEDKKWLQSIKKGAF